MPGPSARSQHSTLHGPALPLRGGTVASWQAGCIAKRPRRDGNNGDCRLGDDPAARRRSRNNPRIARVLGHQRSLTKQQLLALMDTAAVRPTLRFNFVAETRGLRWVEQLRLGTTGIGGDRE